MEFLKSVDKRLNALMPFITPTGVILALLLGNLFVSLKPIVNPLFGVITFFGAMKISAKDMVAAIKRPLFIIGFVLSSYIAMPILAELVSLIFFSGNKALGSGFNLVRAIPTAVVGSIWAMIFHGNIAVSLTILLVDTLLAPIMTPLMLKIFTGTAVEIDSVGMMKSLCMMVVIPFFLGLVFNRFFSKSIKQYIAPATNPLSKLILLFVIIINVSQVAERIKSDASWSYITIAIAAILLAAIGFPVGFMFCKLLRLDKSQSISTTYAVAMRNISAALVLAIDFMPAEAALPVIFSIVFQQTVAAIMGHVLFGKNENADSLDEDKK